MMIRRTIGFIEALVIGLAVLSYGCAGMSSRSGQALSPAESAIREEGRWFSASNIQACLLMGAAAGGLCALLGGNAAQCALSAVAACGIGVGTNQYLQAKRQRYASQEQFLQALIADVNKENQHAATLLTNTKDVIAQDLRKIEAIDQAFKANRVSLAQAQQELQSVDDNKAVLEKALAGMKEKEQSWREVAAANPSPALDQEIRQLQGNIAALEQELRGLVERRNVSAVG